MMELNELMQGGRLVLQLITILIVASYCPGVDAAKRPAVSGFAVMLAGSSASLLMSTLLWWDDWLLIPSSGQLALTLVFAVILIPVIAGRGNMAAFFPRQVWSHRT